MLAPLSRGANQLHHPNADISYWRFKLFLKNIFKSNALQDLEARIALKNWRDLVPSLIPDRPRRKAVAIFRYMTAFQLI